MIFSTGISVIFLLASIFVSVALVPRSRVHHLSSKLPCPVTSPRQLFQFKSAAASIEKPDKEVLALKKKLSREFLSIGLPAFVQLAAEPLASLVDTAYLGRLGPEVLGGAGVAISAQYAVSKLYNDPLLRTSISLVASQDGKSRGIKTTEDEAKKELSIAVSSALLLAFVVGFVQMMVYSLLTNGIIRGMGVDSLNPMWHSAVS